MEQDLVLGSMRKRVGTLVLAGLLAALLLAILGSAGTSSASVADTDSPNVSSSDGVGTGQPIDAETNTADLQDSVTGSGVVTLTFAHEANRLESLATSGELSVSADQPIGAEINTADRQDPMVASGVVTLTFAHEAKRLEALAAHNEIAISADPAAPMDETLGGVAESLPMSPADLADVEQRLTFDSRANPPAAVALGVDNSTNCGDVDVYCLYLPIVSRPLPDHYEVYAMDADGSGLVNVSEMGGGDVDPVYSPDGTRIAWVHYAGNNGEIYVANADGTNRINLSKNSKLETDPTWSEDGTEIAYTRYVGTDHPEIFKRNADGSGSPVQLTDDTKAPFCRSHSPEWSPTGNRIAYICGINFYGEVYVMKANGSNKKRLTDDSESEDGHREDGALDWNPDGIRLAYTKWNLTRKKSDIYVVNANGGGIKNLTDDSARMNSSPVWSPDGSKIAFHAYLNNQNFEVATMNANGSSVTNLTKQGPGSGNYWPRWSADGSMISFLSTRDGNLELYIMNSDGTNQTRMTRTKYDENAHDWDPNLPTP